MIHQTMIGSVLCFKEDRAKYNFFLFQLFRGHQHKIIQEMDFCDSDFSGLIIDQAMNF
jgi:hypothetical protein